MLGKRSVHLKVQEHADCFATADPLKEMSLLKRESDAGEAALKWLALAVLHGVNDSAKRITLTRAPDGSVTVTAKYRAVELPSPGPEIGARIVEAAREIGHFEEAGGRTPLAVGIRDGGLELDIRMEAGEDGETVTIKFPR